MPARNTNLSLRLLLQHSMRCRSLGQLPWSPQITSLTLVLARTPPGTCCPYSIYSHRKPSPVSIMKKDLTCRTWQSLLKPPQFWLNIQQVFALQGTLGTVPELQMEVAATRQKVGIRVLRLQRMRVPILFPPPWNPVY